MKKPKDIMLQHDGLLQRNELRSESITAWHVTEMPTDTRDQVAEDQRGECKATTGIKQATG